MDVESRDSVSLKPAELDEFAQLLIGVGLDLGDALDHQIESFPLVVLGSTDGELAGFLFGSLERVGGTPCILWGLGASRRGRKAGATVKAMTGELYRRAAISFPDEDVLVAARLAHGSAYSLLAVLSDVVPRQSYTPTGEERAWGRRLARRFGCDERYDEHALSIGRAGRSEPIFDCSTVRAGSRAAAALVGERDPSVGEAMIAPGWAGADALADGLGCGH